MQCSERAVVLGEVSTIPGTYAFHGPAAAAVAASAACRAHCCALHLPEEIHAGSLHLQTHNPLSKAPIQLCALSQATTVTRLDTDRKLAAMRLHLPICHYTMPIASNAQ